MKTVKNRNRIGYSIVMVIASSVLVNCASLEVDDFYVDKPQSLIDQEELNAYNPLKEYVEQTNQPNFFLAGEVSLNDATNNTPLYRLLVSNFDQLSITTNWYHKDLLEEDGTIKLDTLTNAFLSPNIGDVNFHVGHLVRHDLQNAEYLNNLVADIIIPGENGNFNAVNFETYSVGDPISVDGSGSATVAEDPVGESGLALHIQGPQTFPKLHIILPENLILGDCKSVTIDFRGAGCCGLYGQGMRMGISASENAQANMVGYGSPSSFGVADGVWTRGAIVLPIANLNLSADQKLLSDFYLAIGSATGSANYHIDNVTLNWEKIGETIVKTPEEKREIFSNELDRWIQAAAEATDGNADSWSVIYRPIDDDNPNNLRTGVGAELGTNDFYWQDYLGEEYAAFAVKKIKEYANQDDKIYFTETNLHTNPQKIQGLMSLISNTEQQGAQVDGIAAELSLNANSVNKTSIIEMLEKLAATNKLIKISSLDVGTGATTANSTSEAYRLQAEIYGWVVEIYNQIIPSNQRGGITFRTPTDQTSNSSWRANEPVGIWTNSSGYQRKLSYKAVAEALSGNIQE